MYKKLVLTTLVVAFAINLLSAFVRLTDAGLGCAGWPACYGAVAAEDSAAKSVYPLVDETKRAIRLVHRLFATLLGLLIVGIAILAFNERDRPGHAPFMAGFLLLLMVALAVVGRFTVHPVQPAIATVNAMGGMAVVACLAWLAMAQVSQAVAGQAKELRALRVWCRLGLGLVFLQALSGVWVSANFAALGCGEFPLCRGFWIPTMDFGAALDWTRPAKIALSPEALAAIHWTHRVAALITLVYLAALAVRLARVRQLAGYGVALGGFALAQAGLGIANVLSGLPLLAVLLHNALGALLLVLVTMLNFKIRF